MVSVWILTVSMTFMAVCYTMIMPFLPVYLLELGVDKEVLPLWSGAVFSIAFFVAGVMAPIWGKIADTHGKKLMALRAAILVGLTYVIMGLVQNEWQLFMARAMAGFANGFMPAAMTMVSLSVPKERVGVAMGIFQTGIVCGNTLGPFIGGVTEATIGMRPVFFAAGCMLFIVSIVVWLFVKEPEVDSTTIEAHSKTSFKEDVQEVRENRTLVHIVGLYFLVQSVMLMLQPVLAIYVGDMKGSMDDAALWSGIILSMGGIAGMISTNLWAYYGQKRGYFKVISFGMLGTGIILLTQGLVNNIWVFGFLQILVGSCVVGIYPSLSAALAVNTDPAVRGRVVGLATMAQQFGSMVGPMFASIVTTFAGVNYVFAVAGVGMLFLGSRVYRLYGNRPNLPTQS